jgi:hypothetical protein
MDPIRALEAMEIIAKPYWARMVFNTCFQAAAALSDEEPRSGNMNALSSNPIASI